MRVCQEKQLHYNDIIMGAIASQITSLMIVFSTVYLDADQREHQSSASLAFVRGIHRGPVNSPHKWPVKRKVFSFDDVIIDTKMICYHHLTKGVSASVARMRVSSSDFDSQLNYRYLNTGSGKGCVPPRKTPLPEPMFNRIFVVDFPFYWFFCMQIFYINIFRYYDLYIHLSTFRPAYE